MVFSSFLFLFLFLPIVLFINRLLPLKVSNVFLLFVSLLFYYMGEQQLTVLLVGSIIWNYVFGLLFRSEKKASLWNKVVLALCIIGNLSLLIYYKYFAFFIKSLGLTELIAEKNYANIALPIGISFFTFQGISYIIDVYRQTEKAEKSPVKLGLYIAFFPQLIAGPILKFNEISRYLSDRTITTDKMIAGSYKFIRGLVKKIVFANNFAIIADLIFNGDIQSLPSVVNWLGVLAYSLQIYYDFSGYSDMAIGLGLMMGFNIPENFRHPYISKSIKEFWQRWHISLSTWFKHYLYIPLGGNRKGKFRTYLNLIVVFFITGLWHGASYNFIIWGMIHGVFLILERLNPRLLPRLPAILRHFYVVLVISITWVFFRLASLDQALIYLKNMFSFKATGDYYALLYLNPYFIFLFIVGILLTMPIRSRIVILFKGLNRSPNLLLIAKSTLYIGLFIYSILALSMATHHPFIYFKF